MQSNSIQALVDVAMTFFPICTFATHPENGAPLQKAVEQFLQKTITYEEACSIAQKLAGCTQPIERLQTILETSPDPLPVPEEFNEDNNKSNLKSIRHKTRPWTQYEDQRLLAGIYHNGIENWTAISKFVGNARTRSQCSQRWYRGLDPAISKDQWTKEEEEKLIEVIAENGDKSWTQIASKMRNRSDVQCRYKYKQLQKERAKEGQILTPGSNPRGNQKPENYERPAVRRLKSSQAGGICKSNNTNSANAQQNNNQSAKVVSNAEQPEDFIQSTISPNLTHNYSNDLNNNFYNNLNQNLSQNLSQNLNHNLSQNLSQNLNHNLGQNLTSPISSLSPNLNGPGVVIPTTPQMMNPQPLEPPPFYQAQQPYFPPIGTFQPHPVLATVQQASQPVMQVPIVVQPMPIQRSPFPSQPPIAPVMTPPQGMFPPLPPPLSQQLQQIPQQIQHSTFQHPPPKTQQSVPPNHQSAHSQIHLQTHPQAHTHTHSLPPQIPVSQTIPVKPKEEPMQFVIPPIPSLSDPHPLIPPISIVSSIQPNIHPNLQTGVTQPKTPQIEPQTHHHVPATSPAMYAIQSPNGILLNPPKEYHVGPKEVGDVQNQAIHVSIKAPTFDGRLYSVY